MTVTQNQENLVLVTDENFDEDNYLISNPDIAQAVLDGVVKSGWVHFDLYGRNEGRKMLKSDRRSSQFFKKASRLFKNTLKQNPGTNFQDQALHAKINNLELRLNDLDVYLRQMQSVLQLASDIPPLPPKHLQVRVVGDYVPDFIRSGFDNIYPDLNRSLNSVGKSLADFHTILDFGCGCGRAIFALARLLPGCQLYGTDIDQEAIEWLTANYSKLAKFSVAPHLPPTMYSDQKFDFVFGISVFTHLPEEMQFQWLSELNRIIKPGGYAIMTIHGEKHYSKLSGINLQIMKNTGFLYVDSHYGESISLPDFYQTAFHSADYIRREWGKYFNIIDIQPLGMQNHQDIVLMQKAS